jgi:hypothetical protein
MARQYVEKVGCSAASRAIVYSVAKRSSGYPDWSMIGSFKLVRPGRDEEWSNPSQAGPSTYNFLPLKRSPYASSERSINQ